MEIRRANLKPNLSCTPKEPACITTDGFVFALDPFNYRELRLFFFLRAFRASQFPSNCNNKALYLKSQASLVPYRVKKAFPHPYVLCYFKTNHSQVFYKVHLFPLQVAAVLPDRVQPGGLQPLRGEEPRRLRGLLPPARLPQGRPATT